MIATALNTRPFAFDTEFASDGEIMRTGAVFAPTKRSYLPAEVEALVAQARLEAREAALAEVESMQAMALVTIGQAVAGSAAALVGGGQGGGGAELLQGEIVSHQWLPLRVSA